MVRSVLFFVAFYLYLWLCVDVRLIYQGGGVIRNFPAFYRGWAFFREFTLCPGGPVEYVSAFLAQLFYYSWAGALVVTLQAWLIAVCADYLLRTMGAQVLRCIRFVPAILLLVLYSRYEYYFAPTVALLTALAGASLYVRVSSGRRLLRVVVFVVLSIVLYYLAGGGYLLFAVMCAIHEVLGERRWQIGILYLPAGAAIPYVVGVMVFEVSIVNAFSELSPLSWKYASQAGMAEAGWALYTLVPLAALIVGLWRRFRGTDTHPAGQSRAKTKRRRKPAGLAARARLFAARKPAFRWVVESLILFAIAGVAGFFAHNRMQKAALEVDYYACLRMWPEVLRAAAREPHGYSAINAVNRALYHTGRLGSEMFAHPQHSDALVLTGEDRVLTYWHKFDTQIDLGLVNMAQKDLTECMAIYGEHPTVLERLALINMVKGDIGAARVYLGALSKTLFHARRANDYLSALQSDPNLSGDRRIQQLRSVCMEKDHPTVFLSIEKVLVTLLNRNRQNRMAFEYLMAWYMLTKQLGKFVQNIERMNDFGDAQFPRHYAEALLIYAYGKREAVFLHGRQIDPALRQRIEHFSQVFNTYGRNKEAAFSELARRYGDTYFFYHLYEFSGVKN